uniref:Calx-beta domain-containing protein n=1 Tax=Desmonostoc muscorum LEGE 12446 TaxID=1828758 RepID=A0A8J7D0G0_DESMC
MFNGNESDFGTEIANNLEVSLQNAYGNLIAASKSDDFMPKMAGIFGGTRDLSRLQALSSSWGMGDFSQLPTIQVLLSNSMNGANGAFSEVTRTIYLSSNYLSQGSSNPDTLTGSITGVLLEEIGHFVDTLINPGSDTAGDEGELFAATVMGLPLSNAEKLLINSEDDRGFITIDGKAIAVEQSNSLSQAPNLRANATIAETPVITIAATDANAAETATGITPNPGTFTLTRTGNLATALTVNYTLSGTATKGTDYSNLTGTVSFAAGANTATIKVTPTDDTLAENSETAILTLKTGTGYTLGTTTTAIVTIADNETPVITIAATDASAGETATGVTPNPGTFTLTRTGNTAAALIVNYTLSGTATKGTDYSNLGGTVTFAAGSATANVNVTPINDTAVELNETVILTLATGTGYNLGTAKSSTVTLSDNDLPTITVAATDASAAETTTGQTANPGRFTLTRTGNTAAALTVNYTLSGTATKGTDYSNLGGTVTFAAGSATANVNVTPINDTVFEITESVIINLTTNNSYVLGASTSATITIKPYLEIQGSHADYEFLNRIIFKETIGKYKTLDVDPRTSGNEGIKTPSGQIYRLFDYIDDSISGFQAAGFISESGAPPVLVFNGTNPDERLGKDILDDLNAAGIGKNQFSNNIAKIQEFINAANKFLKDNGINQRVDITGYSLGGANAQQAVAYFTGKGYKFGSVVTLNSPGISVASLTNFNAKNVEKVTHYIVNNDLVSLAGQAYLPGDYQLVQWNTTGVESFFPFGDKHNTAGSEKFYLSNHLTPNDPNLPDIPRRNGVTLTSNFISKDYLSSPSFSYWSKPTEDWITANIALAILSQGQIPTLLSTRATVEASRELLGTLLAPAIELLTTDNPVNFALTLAKKVLENPQIISDLVNSGDLNGVQTWDSFDWGVFTVKTLFTKLNVGLADVAKLLFQEFDMGIIDVAKVLKNELSAGLGNIADALYKEVSQNFNTIADALWSISSSTVLNVADALWSIPSSTAVDIAKALYNEVTQNFVTIADAVYKEVSQNFNTIADALWSISSSTVLNVADALWSIPSSTAVDIAKALYNEVTQNFVTIADAVYKEVSQNFNTIADALWSISSSTVLNVADALWSIPSSTAVDIAKALYNEVTQNFVTIADAVYKEVSQNFNTIAGALWNGIQNSTRFDVASAIWNGIQSSTVQNVVNALFSIGTSESEVLNILASLGLQGGGGFDWWPF